MRLTLDSAWLSGFVDAEGCFNVLIRARSAAIVGFRTSLRFLLDQQFEQEVNFEQEINKSNDKLFQFQIFDCLNFPSDYRYL